MPFDWDWRYGLNGLKSTLSLAVPKSMGAISGLVLAIDKILAGVFCFDEITVVDIFHGYR
ncbi:hypothetical protein LU276_04710 [Moraxella haemolytica]|uniref:hypothetical protein n=1 Tax=Moraxella haemolytica TaxID=2904119 RepID=UPI002542BDBC|nr:hypothetical protein [Moraxella sp. ZY171148]WII96116.1 hypothetical protein LU276_04710 [Moraxella sp. ZY171148]